MELIALGSMDVSRYSREVDSSRELCSKVFRNDPRLPSSLGAQHESVKKIAIIRTIIIPLPRVLIEKAPTTRRVLLSRGAKERKTYSVTTGQG